MSTEDFQYYNKYNLKKFLRIHSDYKVEPITDTKERAIRRSFDAMIYFFFKLQYLYNIGILKKNELYYFNYEFNLMKNTDIRNYIKGYGLQLDENFVDDISNMKYEDRQQRRILTKIKNKFSGKNTLKHEGVNFQK
jgi:hypothetical protein